MDCDRRNARHRILILGGGFSATCAAQGPERTLARQANVDMTLINRDNDFLSSGSVILPELKEKLGRYARGKLAERGIEILTNVQVRGATDQCIELSDGRRIVSNTLIWTAGNSIHPLLAATAATIHQT